MKRLVLFGLLAVSLVFTSCSKSETSGDTSPYVILVSFDGFRHDYAEKFNATNFKDFASKGASAEAMISSYPTKTFPNHYTIVTGMYPGNHGLVDNTFYDPGRETTYRIGSRTHVEDAYYYEGLPLWQLVQQNGMKSASYFWVGSEAPIAGSYPDYYHIYDGSVPNEDRIIAVREWLNLPKNERPQFITLYFSFVDSQGHATGPNAPQTGEAVLEADRLLGLLMQYVNASDLNINVILTSDHGMLELQNKEGTLIYTDDIFEGLDMDDVNLLNNGTHAHLFIENPQDFEDIMHFVKPRENNFKIYSKEEIPEEWHYQNSNRIGDIFIVADPGHHLTSRASQAFRPETRQVWGNHGFDPYASDDMGAIFYAQGPQIKEGLQIGQFENIHVYPLVAEILGIKNIPQIDGSLSVLESILK